MISPSFQLCVALQLLLPSGLLSAVRVVFMVVVLSLCLLVTEEVAPPAFRVGHLSGRPSVLRLLHLLGHKYKVRNKFSCYLRLHFVLLSVLVGLNHYIV